MPLTLAWVGLGLATMGVVILVQRRRNEARQLTAIRRQWGLPRDRDHDMTAIAAYSRARTKADGGAVDDRTWGDLNMDAVFAVLDRTESVVGQQVLYARLRRSPLGDPLDAFEALVTRMSGETAARERAQMALARLRDTAAYDLWWLTEPGALNTERWHFLFPMLGLSMAGVIALLLFWPPAILLAAAGFVASLMARSSVAPQLRVVAGAFRQVGPLLAAAEMLAVLDGPDVRPITGPLTADGPRLSRLRRFAGWAGRDATGAAAGDLSALMVEYLNVLFCLDANALVFGGRELRARAAELLRVLIAVGDVDAAVSIASYRAGTTGWTRPTFRPAGEPAVMADIRHPLLPDAVPNSTTLCPPHGVILTGSNMSGKSTFLRTVGVTTILAQTIHTCLASRYEAPAFVVRSCIGRADDPASGKSYYVVEVESVLSLVQAAGTSVPHLLIFDELFRGTNVIERIAAGEAVLTALLGPRADGQPVPHAVLVATHDQELVDLLQGLYAPYHFTDTVAAEGLAFDYQLRPGPSTTRNAIALLAARGAPPDLVAHARALAMALDRARRAPGLS